MLIFYEQSRKKNASRPFVMLIQVNSVDNEKDASVCVCVCVGKKEFYSNADVVFVVVLGGSPK